MFRDKANRVNLPREAVHTWEALLEARRPEDDELVVIQDDLNDTPIATRDAILGQLANGVLSVDTLEIIVSVL